MTLYATDATQWPPEGFPIIGKDALRKLFQSVFALPDYSLSWAASKASVAESCDLAYTLGTWHLTSRNGEGQLVTSEGTYLAVSIRSSEGNWLVLEDIFNGAAA